MLLDLTEKTDKSGVEVNTDASFFGVVALFLNKQVLVENVLQNTATVASGPTPVAFS